MVALSLSPPPLTIALKVHAADSCSSGPRKLRQMTACFHKDLLSMWGNPVFGKRLGGFGFPEGSRTLTLRALTTGLGQNVCGGIGIQ